MIASLTLAPEFAAALAAALADELERRGAFAASPASPWLSTEEASSYLRCGKQRIFDLTSARKLPVYKDGSRNLYRREDLDAYLEGAVA